MYHKYMVKVMFGLQNETHIGVCGVRVHFFQFKFEMCVHTIVRVSAHYITFEGIL